MRSRIPTVLLARLLALGACIACTGETSPSHTPRAPLVYVGSVTIGERVMVDATREFTARTGIPFADLRNVGSVEGLDGLLRGEADLAGLSRSLTLAEKQLGLGYVVIGHDPIGVFVHPANPVASLTHDELRAIYTGRVRNWKEVGGLDAPVVCITQTLSAKTGKMLEFQQRVLHGAAYREDRTECDRQSDQARALAAEPHGIAALSFAFATPEIRDLEIHDDTDDADDGRPEGYAFIRPLILVTKPQSSPAVEQFLDFILSKDGQAIVDRSFLPIRGGITARSP